MSQLQLPVELPRTKPTLALESCADFFDRDYDTLAIDVANRVITFAWDIAAAGASRREIRIYAPSAWAFVYGKPMPAMSEDDAKQIWLLTAPARVVVAADDDLILALSFHWGMRAGRCA